MTRKTSFVSTTRKNQFELVTASINHLHLLCTTTSKQFSSQYEPSSLVSTTTRRKEKLDWANYSQFQQAVRTRKNQFELDTAVNEKENQFCLGSQLVTASFNDKNKHSFNNDYRFEPGRTGLSKSPSFNNQEEPVWASHSQYFNDKEKPVWASYSQYEPSSLVMHNNQ